MDDFNITQLLESRNLKANSKEYYQSANEEYIVCKFNEPSKSQIEGVEFRNSLKITTLQDAYMNNDTCPLSMKFGALLYKERSNAGFYEAWRNLWLKTSGQVYIANNDRDSYYLNGCSNFGHFVFEDLTRAVIIGKLIKDDTKVLIGGKINHSKISMLSALGIPAENQVIIDEKTSFHQNIKIVESPVGRSESGGLYQATPVIKELRSKLGERSKNLKSREWGKKIYLKRGDVTQKRLVNENEIISFLQSRGFEIIDGLTTNIWDQINSVYNAELVVGALGASTALSVFARDGAKIIELHPNKRVAGQLNCLQSRIAHKFEYYKIIGNKVFFEDNANPMAHEEDYTLEINKLAEIEGI